MRFRLLCFLVFLVSPYSQAVKFESGNQQVALLELYTSEGCSSCPPADRWISKLKNDEQLWKSVIPIAFHVDYWDYIGWKDRFADKRYSERQRNYAREQSMNTVYTPGFMLNGKEWRRWRHLFNSDFSDKAQEQGNLILSINENNQFEATFETQQTGNKLILNIAVLGMGLSSEVQRGENRGRKLNHDFVVLALKQYSAASDYRWQNQLPETSDVSSRTAIAAWVSSEYSQVPIQSVGGYLD